MGIDPETARGKLIFDVVPSAQDRRHLYERVLAGESLDLQSVPFLTPGESKERYYDVHLRPVWEPSGDVVGLLTAVVDVTVRHELDQQKDQFIALASHELKTPVTAIKGYAQTGLRAVSSLGDERLTRMLNVISEQSDRLTRLINELLDVSRMEADTLDFYKQPFDLLELIREVVSNFELTADDIRLAVEMPAEPVIVHADRQRIEQVLINLMQNAAKYSTEDRSVEVNVSVANGEAVVAVRDFGVGIPVEQQSQVFKRFFRASNVASSRYSGLGLGLFISHGIVERHGGRMWLESKEGDGSTFYFALPLEDVNPDKP
jgi:two-component system CheB/CheR fusion protein